MQNKPGLTELKTGEGNVPKGVPPQSDPPQSMVELAETAGRHYRSPHLQHSEAERRTGRVWVAGAVLVTVAALILLWLLLP